MADKRGNAVKTIIFVVISVVLVLAFDCFTNRPNGRA